MKTINFLNYKANAFTTSVLFGGGGGKTSKSLLKSKKHLLFVMMAVMCATGSVWADTYTHTFTSAVFSTTNYASAQSLTGKDWLLTPIWNASAYFSYESNRGLQIGSQGNPALSYTLVTSDFADKTITSVVVTANGYNATPKLQITVGTTSNTATNLTTGTTPVAHTWTGSASGNITISMTDGTSSTRAVYIKSITITYSSAIPSCTPAAQSITVKSLMDLDLGTKYLGDNLDYDFSHNWNDNWHSSQVGFGTNADGLTGWNWGEQWSATYLNHESQGNACSNTTVRRTIQFPSTGNYFIIGRVKGNSSDEYVYATQSCSNDAICFSLSHASTVTVLPLVAPTVIDAESATINSITLNATKWNSKRMLIVRYPHGTTPTTPTGDSYGTGGTIGNEGEGKVLLFDFTDGDLTDSSLSPNTQYDYYFYSENYGYYSPVNTVLTLSTEACPALAAPVALAAEDLTTSSFTAKWSGSAEEYELSVYTKTAGEGYATDLFISEYGEGSSNNRYIEIYNGTGVSVDLSNYTLKQAYNGAGWDQYPRYTLALTGTMPSNSTYVIANSAADATVLNLANLTLTYDVDVAGSALTSFTGNDAIGLFKNGTLIDVFGNPNGGTTTISVAGYSTYGENHTIVRKPSVYQGNTDWTISSGTNTTNSEWIGYPQDTWTYLGSHTMNTITADTKEYITGYNPALIENGEQSKAVIGLSANTDYYYVVKAKGTGVCADVISAASEEIKVDISTTTAAKTVTTAKTAIKTQYFTADGREVSPLATGVIIIKTTYDDGSVTVTKESKIKN